MQGKFVCSQSASTFLFLSRLSIAARYPVPGGTSTLRTRKRNAGGSFFPPPRIGCSLLRDGEICFAAASHGDRFRLILRALVPHRDRITSVRDVFDLVVAAVICLGEIRCWAYYKISRHVRVYVAEQRHYPGLVESEGALFTLGPGA